MSAKPTEGLLRVRVSDHDNFLAYRNDRKSFFFLTKNLPFIQDDDDLNDEFERFWNEEQQKAFSELVDEEGLDKEKAQSLIEGYLFVERPPLKDDALTLIKGKQPSVLHRKTIGERIVNRIVDFVETFINVMDR